MGKNQPTKEIKVVVGVPCADSASMKAQTAHTIGCTILRSEGLVIDFLLRMSCDIVSNRTWLVNEAIKRGATHLLFVDCDMMFGPEALKKLLAHGKEIVGVEYNKREFPLKGVYEPLESKADTLYKAKFAGMGLMLIDLSIFPKIGKPSEMHPRGNPWFSFGRDSQGALVLGEDAWFSNVARDAGIDTWIDPTIKVAHIGEYLY
jgi:hypothetical protein